jgi:hypothetical protein
VRNSSIKVEPEAAALFTLERQHLIERAPADNAIDVLGDILGLNAQGAMNYQLSLWNRVSDLDREFIPVSLFEERSLVRTWLMRDTVHIVPSRLLPLMRSALKESLIREWNRWTVRTGAKEEPSSWEFRYPHVLEALEDGPLTVNQILETLGWSWDDAKRGLHRLIREMSHQGFLCHAISSGPWYHSTEHSFSRLDGWLTEAESSAPETDAKTELARCYLKGYGPASVNDFAYWTGMRVMDAKPIFESLSEPIVEVEITGQKRMTYILEEDVSNLQDQREVHAHARLLPQFDALVMGHKDKTRFIEPSSRSSIFLPRADVAATILLDGRVEGVWKMRKEKRRWRLEFSPFRELSEEEEEALGREIEELRRFTGFEIVVDTALVGSQRR